MQNEMQSLIRDARKAALSLNETADNLIDLSGEHDAKWFPGVACVLSDRILEKLHSLETLLQRGKQSTD